MTKHVMRTELVAAFAMLASTAGLHAAEVKPETLRAWDQYIATTESQMTARLQSQAPFLCSAESADTMLRARGGEIIVAPVAHNPKRIPNALIHHWTGLAFFPNSTIGGVFAVVHDYRRYKEYYGPLVIDSKLLGREGDRYRFTMLIMNQSLFSKSALDGEYTETYLRISDTRWYSIARSTRVQQIDDFGGDGEHRLPPDEGSGYIWRLYSVSRFEERDRGVYVEIEVIALSRDIPVSLRWFIDPIVRRVSRSSLLTSLEKTRAAVQVEAAMATHAHGAAVVAQIAAENGARGR